MTDVGGIVFVAINAALAVGCGWWLAGLLSRLDQRPGRKGPAFATLFGVYVVEAGAFAASMGTDILSIGLALVWGLVLGLWLPKSRVPADAWRRIVRLSAIYTSLPAASFLSVPIVAGLGGWPVLSAEAGARFGIPGFVPWPVNTILGFCVLVAAFAVVAKVAGTTTVAGAVARRARKSKTDER